MPFTTYRPTICPALLIPRVWRCRTLPKREDRRLRCRVKLFGPPAKTLIPSITKEEFVQTVRDYATGWTEREHNVRGRKGQAYAILRM
jgi:hypothetical protein